MISLPSEVLLLIFSHLVTRDKLECMTVCRQWRDIIFDHSLFEVIFIHREQQLKQLIERVSENPTLGAKVEQLCFRIHLEEDFYGKTIVQLFPNVRHFDLISYNSEFKDTKPNGQKNLWNDHIQTVVESGSDLQTKMILGSGLCKKLTSITTASDIDYTTSYLFGLLKNAPALRKLHLRGHDISYEDLELIHRNVPLLNTLVLQSTRFIDSTVSSDIKPATLLKSFRCWNTDFDPENPHEYLSYASKKYTHLEEFEFDARGLDYIYNDVDENGTPITKYPKELVKTLGPQLKKLSLFMDNLEDNDLSQYFDFNVLDESGCQIERLDLDCLLFVNSIKKLADSNQARSIQSLSLAQLYSDDYNYIFFDELTSFTNLKELTLGNKDSGKPTLNLTDIMGKTNKSLLEDLRLYHFHLELDYSNTTLVYPLLRDLTLSDVDFKTGTDLLLSRIFPSLKRVKLRDFFSKKNSFMLPSANLSYLEIINIDVKESFPILVITLADGQQRVYNTAIINYNLQLNCDIPEEDKLMLPSVYSVPFDKLKDVPLATVVCNSIDNFVLINSSSRYTCFK